MLKRLRIEEDRRILNIDYWKR